MRTERSDVCAPCFGRERLRHHRYSREGRSSVSIIVFWPSPKLLDLGIDLGLMISLELVDLLATILAPHLGKLLEIAARFFGRVSCALGIFGDLLLKNLASKTKRR